MAEKDYIEREAAKLRIFEYGVKHRDNANIASACENLERQINSIPAADVRPVVKARWVYTDMSRLVCSNCGNPVAFALKDDGWHHGDFCPNCGADMREEQDGK